MNRSQEECELTILLKEEGKNCKEISIILEAYGFPHRSAGNIRKFLSREKSKPSKKKVKLHIKVLPPKTTTADKIVGKRVLAIGDIHSPFEHRDYLDFLLDTYSKWDCNEVVCMGDEVDAHALSKYVSDPDGDSAGVELSKAINHLKPYYDAFPNVKVCTSNHTVRGFKKGYENGIPSAFFKSYREVLEAPEGWQWERHWEIDGVIYHHGEGFSGMMGHRKAAISAMRSTVIGHIHSAGGVSYIQTEFDRIFGLQTGCGVDNTAYAFAYGKNHPMKPTLGCGVILGGTEAYFIPL